MGNLKLMLKLAECLMPTRTSKHLRDLVCKSAEGNRWSSSPGDDLRASRQTSEPPRPRLVILLGDELDDEHVIVPRTQGANSYVRKRSLGVLGDAHTAATSLLVEEFHGLLVLSPQLEGHGHVRLERPSQLLQILWVRTRIPRKDIVILLDIVTDTNQRPCIV